MEWQASGRAGDGESVPLGVTCLVALGDGPDHRREGGTARGTRLEVGRRNRPNLQEFFALPGAPGDAR